MTDHAAAGPCLAGDVRPFLDDHAPALVAQYFTSGAFTGAHFDTLGGGGDAPPTMNTFTSDDLVAITMLGVRVTAHGALRLLKGEFDSLLAQIPVDADLTDRGCPIDLVDEGSAASRLWQQLCTVPDVGWVVAHKLSARKRPLLLPVYDKVVKAALQPNIDAFRVPLWRELRDPALVERLREVRAAAGLDERTPLLRVLDVAVWMRNQGTLQVAPADTTVHPLPFTPCPHFG